MIVFLKKNAMGTGLGKHAIGFSSLDNVRFGITDDFSEFNTSAELDDVAVYAGFLPHEIRWMLPRFKRNYYLYCSPLGQAYLSGPSAFAPELEILKTLLDMRKKHLTNILFSSKHAAQIFDAIHCQAILRQYDTTFIPEGRYGYGFPGNNFRKHKNVANTLAAISLLKPREAVYVQNPSHYTDYQSMFNLDFQQCAHRLDADQQAAMASHRLAFQLSYSESFDYTALEYALHGVPCICSPCISWYPLSFCIVHDLDDPISIAKTAQSVLEYTDYKYLQDQAIKINNDNTEYFRKEMSKL